MTHDKSGSQDDVSKAELVTADTLNSSVEEVRRVYGEGSGEEKIELGEHDDLDVDVEGIVSDLNRE